MPESDRFITLRTQLNSLKDEFLPEISPTSSYSESQLSRTAAYRVLAHAEIESYLEERAWEIVIDAKEAWKMGKTTRTLICLLGFSGLTMDKPPDTLKKPNNVKQDNHDKQLQITEKINSAINSFKKVIDNNHGLKEKNILALLLPIGIDSNDLDTAWLATMETFGRDRGLVAHTSAKSYMTNKTPDPANELNTVTQITDELLRIDELINNLIDSYLVTSNNMNLNNIKQKLFPIIKIISTALITSAIGLELWNLNNQLPSILTPALIIAHIALSAHFIEALIAAYYAPTRNQTAIKYAIYTFFVGTVGLLELWENPDT